MNGNEDKVIRLNKSEWLPYTGKELLVTVNYNFHSMRWSSVRIFSDVSSRELAWSHAIWETRNRIQEFDLDESKNFAILQERFFYELKIVCDFSGENIGDNVYQALPIDLNSVIKNIDLVLSRNLNLITKQRALYRISELLLTSTLCLNMHLEYLLFHPLIMPIYFF